MTLELNIESNTPTLPSSETEGSDNESISEKQRAFARHIFDVYEKTMSESDRLSALYQVDFERFEEEIDDAVDNYLEDDDDFQEFFARFRKARQSGSGDAFVPEMKERRNKARELIMASLNLPDVSHNLGTEEATKNIEVLLKDVPKEPENIDLALNTLGIKTPLKDEPGEFIYAYPYDLLPEKVNDKWKEYLNTVLVHMDLAEHATKENRDDVVIADHTRTIAHNAITKNFHEILQLDQFGLKTEDTRRLLGRIRNDELLQPAELRDTYRPMTQKELEFARKLARHRTSH